MAQKKVVISESPEAVKNLEFDDVKTLSMTEDEDAIDVRDMEYVDEVGDDGVAVEDLDDSEEIWPGGPNAGMIKQWKENYGEVYVTSISFDKHIVWRVLNRLEYKNIVRKMENMIQTGELSSAEANMWNEEAIAEMCMLYPEYDKNSLTGMMAGTPSLIAQEVLEASGFVALEVRQL